MTDQNKNKEIWRGSSLRLPTEREPQRHHRERHPSPEQPPAKRWGLHLPHNNLEIQHEGAEHEHAARKCESL